MSGPCSQQDKGEAGNLSIEEVAADLRPLMLWMANSMELLNLVQKRVLDIEKDLDMEGEPRILDSLGSEEVGRAVLNQQGCKGSLWHRSELLEQRA